MRKLIFSATLIGSLSIFAAAAAQTNSKWSDRGVFVFGNLSLDFEKGQIRRGWKTGPLENCSDASYYCARSEFLTVVLPKKCSADLRVGDAWKVAGVETRVVGTIDEPVGHLGTPGGVLYVLQTSGNPRVALIYRRSSGVLSLLSDPNKDLDLSWTKPRGRGDYGEITASPYWRGVYGALVTFDAFGGCYG